MKKDVLIIFSSQGSDYAEVLQKELEDVSYTVLEKQVLGLPMQNRFEKLIHQLKLSDYGIAVITEDYAKDHNIMFLIGLLIGNLGIERFSLLVPDKIKGTVLCDYLEGFEPNYFDTKHPNLNAAIGQAMYNTKQVLQTIGKRKNQRDFDVLENKKELLRIALDSCGLREERFNPFLAHLIEVFETEYSSIKSKALGATLFALKDDCLKQIATAGIIKKNHCFSLAEEDKHVVQCYKQADKVMLSEKVGRFPDDENVYEYIFYKCIHKKYVLTVHIKCDCKIEDHITEDYLKSLVNRNAGYISILQLFLKGGKYCCKI